MTTLNQGKRNDVVPPKRLFRYLNDSDSHRLAFLSCLSGSELKRISVALWVCLILLIWFLPHSGLEDNVHWSVRALVALAIAVAAGLFYSLGNSCLVYERRVKAAEEPDMKKLFSRRIILYLRSFEDDEKAAKFPSIKDTDEKGFPSEVVPLDYTEEEQLKTILDEFGNFLAIRKPDDAFPHSGATRLRVGHEWQKQVRELMEQSLFVVIRLGTTDGLLWELQTAARCLEPCRLLLLVPFDEMEYNNFCDHHQDVFPKSLPRYDQGEKVGSLRGIIWFHEDWTPEFHTLKTSELYSPKQSLQSALKVALMPFIDRLNVPYQPLHLSPRGIFRWSYFGSGACFFLSVPIWASPAPPLWWSIPASAMALFVIACICAEMRQLYCLRRRFPGRY